VLRFFCEAGAGTLPTGFSTDWENWTQIDDWTCDHPDWLVMGYTFHTLIDQLSFCHGIVCTKTNPLYYVMYNNTRHYSVFRRGEDEYFIFCGGKLLFRYQKSYATLDEFFADPIHVDFVQQPEEPDKMTVLPELEQIPFGG
jgi:hypothetical protein